jgi:DNA-binding NarL/FixJ family response regulator
VAVGTRQNGFCLQFLNLTAWLRLKGSTFYCPSISKRVLARCQTPAPRGGPLKESSNRLSSREVEVLQLIAEGKANKQVAAELCLSFKTTCLAD